MNGVQKLSVGGIDVYNPFISSLFELFAAVLVFVGRAENSTEFSDCDLRKSDLRKARGYNINLLSNRIKGAKFSYPDVINLLEPFDIKIEK